MKVVVTSYKRRMTSWGQSTVGPRCLTSASKSLAPVDSGHISEDRHLIARGWWRQVCWWERLTAGGAGRRPGGERRMPCLPLHLTCSKLENRFWKGTTLREWVSFREKELLKTWTFSNFHKANFWANWVSINTEKLDFAKSLFKGAGIFFDFLNWIRYIFRSSIPKNRQISKFSFSKN